MFDDIYFASRNLWLAQNAACVTLLRTLPDRFELILDAFDMGSLEDVSGPVSCIA